MNWNLVVAGPARRQLRKLPLKDYERILSAFRQMQDNPFSGDVKFLQATGAGFRRRVGNDRILYDIQTKQRVITILEVLRRNSTTY